MAKIITERTKATTPPSLLGIERKIAYANKKYHSGWIWTGVTIGLAGIKFSGSSIFREEKKQIVINKVSRMINPNRSFDE